LNWITSLIHGFAAHFVARDTAHVAWIACPVYINAIIPEVGS
jgi:hypothetical protein